MEHLFPKGQCGPSLHRVGAQHISVQQMIMCQLMSSLGMMEAGETKKHLLSTCNLWF